VLYGFIVVYIV